MSARVVTPTEPLTPEEEAVHAVSTAVLKLLAECFPHESPDVGIGGLVSATLTMAVAGGRTAVTIDLLRESIADLSKPTSPIHALAPTTGTPS
ncbi:MAG: hypothetical protein HQL41_18660 [Alphaproteobacteria bacterium]|nr:hypothetical protein [Alphaproteobacteria bacterium]